MASTWGKAGSFHAPVTAPSFDAERRAVPFSSCLTTQPPEPSRFGTARSRHPNSVEVTISRKLPSFQMFTERADGKIGLVCGRTNALFHVQSTFRKTEPSGAIQPSRSGVPGKPAVLKISRRLPARSSVTHRLGCCAEFPGGATFRRARKTVPARFEPRRVPDRPAGVSLSAPPFTWIAKIPPSSPSAAAATKGTSEFPRLIPASHWEGNGTSCQDEPPSGL